MNSKRQLVFWLPVAVIWATTVAISLSLIASKAFSHKDGPEVSFSEWVPVKQPQDDDGTFRFAVASMVNPEETWATYKKLVDYLGEHLGRETALVLKPSYGEVRVLLEQSKVDAAFVCTGTYLVCRATNTVGLLAVPEFERGMQYRCFFITGAHSGINNIQDLQGRSFAFTDPESNTGCIVPKWALKREGFDPETHFGRLVYTKSHDRSIRAVARGVVDGAGIDSLIYNSLVRAEPKLGKKLKVIWQSEPFGMPPIVVPVALPDATKGQLRTILLSMSKDPKGRAILDDLGIRRFRKPDPNEYDSAHRIWKDVGREKGAG